MSNLNPMQFIQMIRNGQNPEQLMMNFLQSQMAGTPMGENLISLAQKQDSKGIEQIARNLLSSRGLDFDKEFMAFKQLLGLK